MSQNKKTFFAQAKKTKPPLAIFKTPAAIIGILVFLMAAFFILSQGSSAADLGAQLNANLSYGTLTGLGTRDIRAVAMLIVNILLGFLAVLAICIILYAGYIWMTSGGDANKIDRAKRILTNAVIGLIIIFMSYSIAAFIIGLFLGGAGGGGPRSPGNPPGACNNCGALGGGIIESVYPAPAARDVARDTLIFVTFKEIMDDRELCADPACSTDIKAGDDNVKITYRDPVTNVVTTLTAAEVGATKADARTYIFSPRAYLGDGARHVWYTVRLGKNIKKFSGAEAFPGLNDHFDWSFEVGTRLDQVAPYISGIFPQPDALRDTFNPVAAQQAVWRFTVGGVPETGEIASFDPVAAPVGGGNDTVATVSGSYGCASDSQVTIQTIGPGRFQLTSAPGVTGFNSTVILNAVRQIDLGCGLRITFDANAIEVGNQWRFNVVSQKSADTVIINNRTYTFSTLAGANRIVVGADAVATATSIRTAVNADQATLAVSAGGAGAEVILTAVEASAGPNRFSMGKTGSWTAGITQTTQGRDGGIERVDDGTIEDQPKNVIIQIKFSETMLPIPIAGEIAINDGADNNGVGTLTAPGTAPFITVQADIDDDGGFEADEFVGGTFEVSNLYKTAEFKPLKACAQTNSCGETIYCLPVVGNTTKYLVTVRAATLQGCGAGCRDPNFNTCAAGHCQNADGDNFPKAVIGAIDGVVDAANNSLDGDNYNNLDPDKNTEGPVNTHKIGVDAPGANGDSAEWSFFISNRLDLTAPRILAPTISPAIQNDFTPVTARPQAQFNKMLMSSTLRPDSGYRDGICGCGGPADCPDEHTCLNNKCVAESGRRQFLCLEDSDCGSRQCLSKSYVTLVDNACVSGSGQCTGWWIENDGIDTSIPPDSFPNQSRVYISHTPFEELTQYGADLGSGVRDIYQNCFNPSSSVLMDEVTPACTGAPYCCDGVPSGVACS